MTGDIPDKGPDDATQAREFARRFDALLDWVREVAPVEEGRAPVLKQLSEHLGDSEHPLVSREWGGVEHVNLQRAVDHWLADGDRTVTVIGVSAPPHFADFGLGELIDGRHLPPLRTGTPDITDLPSGPGETLACWKRALLLAHDASGDYALLVTGPQPHEERVVRIEVAGLDTAAAQQLLADLDRSRSELNVFRGHTIIAEETGMGGISLQFADVPAVHREDVILPEAVLARVDRHALDITAHAQTLRDSGQHLKRGLLLFGPPGTGKTHTVRYLVGQRADATRILLQGEALRAVGAIAGLARELAPSVVVLEDVDLVAADRSYGEHNPVLFSLLEAMDGSAPDADILFVLTTNRAEVLERALVQRPGRVDVAVEVERPDAAARLKLLQLYGAGVIPDLAEEDRTAIIDATDGVTASFLKELIRRSVLAAITGDDRGVSASHIRSALDDLLDQTQSVTRSLLGVESDRTDYDFVDGDSSDDDYPRPGPGPGPQRGSSFGWFAYAPRRHPDVR